MTNQPVDITIVFSSYNGAEKLPRMLDALNKQTLPMERWKIVAVDNNSNDNTYNVLRSFQDRLPIEIYKEAKQGKAHALNTGFQYLEGDLIVITDDDVIPAPEWLEQFLHIAEAQPDYDIFGGLILPAWEQEPPEWIREWVHQGIVYALNDELPEGDGKARWVSGPNSAFRRRILPDSYIVDETLGPNATVGQYAMGEDVMFAASLEAKGAKVYHCRDAVVHHIIPTEYLDEQWILSRAERYGLGNPIVNAHWFEGKLALNGIPITTWLRYAALNILRKPIEWLPKSRLRFQLLWQYYMNRGMLKTMHAMSRAKEVA